MTGAASRKIGYTTRVIPEIPAAGDPGAETPLINSVLLIDGDNDPHLPPDFQISERALVRVFLRTGAKMPRGLERRLSSLPGLVTVISPKGGGNAADFVMSLHAGILHATLPMHLPFTLVTADKSLAVMADELQRVGRQAVLWTSHAGRAGRRKAQPPGRSQGAGPAGLKASIRRRREPLQPEPARRSASAAGMRARPPASPEPPPRPTGHDRIRGLAEVAGAYALRLARIKDPPSRVKALLNDIKNRALASGHTPEEILEELKRSHGLEVDARGRVQHPGRTQG